MASFEIRREARATGSMLALHGTFNGESALALREAINGSRDENVTVDFAHVRNFMDLAVPIFARGLRQERLMIFGLSVHHERLLRYFGVRTPLPTTPALEYWRPEEAAAR